MTLTLGVYLTVIIVLCVAIVILTCKLDNFKLNAINRKFAHWKVDEHGFTTFEWNEK